MRKPEMMPTILLISDLKCMRMYEILIHERSREQRCGTGRKLDIRAT
jgi:hypothetical protein